MEPLVSIIVPVYNVEKYLPRCLDSIVAQTYQNLEIILVDDGSTDSSGMICDQYKALDSRIRVIPQKNMGVAAARNTGLDAMTGEYLMFVDSDDWISGDAVRVLYDRMIQDGSDMAIGKHANVYENGIIDYASYSWVTDAVFSGQEVMEKLGDTQRFAVVPWGKLYRCGLFENLRYPLIACGEDCWIYPFLLEKCRLISSVRSTIYFYYQRDNSILHTYSPTAQKDNLEANLRMSRILLDQKYYRGAHKWYGNSVTRALQCENNGMARQMISQYFTKEEQHQLMRGQNIKIKLKWLGIHVPALGKLMLMVNNTLKRKK